MTSTILLHAGKILEDPRKQLFNRSIFYVPQFNEICDKVKTYQIPNVCEKFGKGTTAEPICHVWNKVLFTPIKKILFIVTKESKEAY